MVFSLIYFIYQLIRDIDDTYIKCFGYFCENAELTHK
jgi:hypothetical protein